MRSAATILAAILLMLAAAPAGAQEPTEEGVGTARTSLTAVDASVSGVPRPVQDLRVLDLVGTASTDPDPARNPGGISRAEVTAIPLSVAGQAVGTTTAASDGERDHRGIGAERSVGPVDAAVRLLRLTARADDRGAAAILDGAEADLSLLAGAIGASIEEAGAMTAVSPTGAIAAQRIVVPGVPVGLGDLLDVDALPLDVVVDLSRHLGDLLDGAAGDVLDRVRALTDEVEGLAAALEDLLADYDAAVDRLTDLLDRLDSLEAQAAGLRDRIDEARALLDAGGATQDVVDSIQEGADDAVEGATGAVDDTTDTLQDTVEDTTDDTTDTVDDTVDDTTDTVDDTTDTVDDTVDDLLSLSRTASDGHDTDAQLTQIIDDLTATLAAVEETIATVEDTLGDIRTRITSLLTEARTALADLPASAGDLRTALQGLLDRLPDVLDQLDGVDLVDVGEIVLDVTARADAAGAEASIDCSLGHVRVLDVHLDALDCTTLTGGLPVLGDAVGRVHDLLGSLPATAAVPAPRLALFPTMTEETSTADGYHRARTQVVALRLGLPSVELGEVTDGAVEQLRSAELSSLLETVRSQLEADAADPVLDTLTDVAAEIDATLAEVTAAQDLLAQIETAIADLVASLPAADALAGLSTPGLDLTVDPVSTAEFRPAAAPGSGDGGAPGTGDGTSTGIGSPGGPGGTPAGGTPAAPGTPNLPSTGGGAGLAAVALLGAAALLRRRR